MNLWSRCFSRSLKKRAHAFEVVLRGFGRQSAEVHYVLFKTGALVYRHYFLRPLKVQMTLTKESLARKIDGLIRSAGFAYICVGQEGRTPPFAYTIGLTETYGCPELLIFGVGQQVADAVFHGLVDKIKSGVRFADGDLVTQVLNVACAIKAVPGEAARPFALNVMSRYQGGAHTPAFQQVVYPDQAGLFPWEVGYAGNMRQIQSELWANKFH